MTVRELMMLIVEACEDWDDLVYVELEDGTPVRLDESPAESYNWGFVIGGVEEQ